MKIIHKYIMTEIYAPYLIGLFTFTLVILLQRFSRLADLIVAKGVPAHLVGRLLLSLFPSFLEITLPAALLLAVLLAMGRLTADSETTAFFTAGIGMRGVAPPVLAVSALTFFASLLISWEGIPWGQRELSDALRRRCLYLWVDFPGFDKEVRIVMRKVPGVNEALARQISRFMESLRTIRLAKVPGVAETLDWAQALASLHADHVDEELVLETLGCVLKDADDVKRFKRELHASGLKRFVAAEG